MTEDVSANDAIRVFMGLLEQARALAWNPSAAWLERNSGIPKSTIENLISGRRKRLPSWTDQVEPLLAALRLKVEQDGRGDPDLLLGKMADWKRAYDDAQIRRPISSPLSGVSQNKSQSESDGDSSVREAIPVVVEQVSGHVQGDSSAVRVAWYIRRRVGLGLAGTVALILISASLGLYFTWTSSGFGDAAAGGVALIRENGSPRLVFQIASGGIGYCIRSDDEWSQPWSRQVIDSSWPGISDAAIFYSGFSGFEVLGVNGGVLTFGYRDNVSQWHNPEPVLDDQSGAPIEGVAGRPGFFQYWPDERQDPKFLALVPVDSGGLELYMRDGISLRWHFMGDIASGLGRISSVSLSYPQGREITAVLRVGSHLYEMSRGSDGLPIQLAAGWSQPREVIISGGKQIVATGSPALIYSDFAGDANEDEFLLAVPVRQGLALLSARDASSSTWSFELLPVAQQPDSVTLLDGYADSRQNLEVAYRQGTRLYSLSRQGGGPWRGPSQIMCG